MKQIKVFMGNERLKDIYPHATKWQVFKYRVRRFVRKVIQLFVLGSVISGVIAIAFFYGKYGESKTALADNVDSLTSKIDSLKNDVVNQIAECETGNANQDTAIVKYDNNSHGTLKGKNIASIGVLQFKVDTVQMFWKQLHKEELSNYEATLLALDNERAKSLAKEAIFELQGAVFHWTCASKDIVEEVKIIKKLTN